MPALKTMARTSTNLLARIHALWTLEGLGALDAALVREVMKRRRSAACASRRIRASETLYKAGDKSFAADYRALAKDADPNVVIQAMLTLNLLKVPDAPALISRRRRRAAEPRRQGDRRRRSCKRAIVAGAAAVARRHRRRRA